MIKRIFQYWCSEFQFPSRVPVRLDALAPLGGDSVWAKKGWRAAFPIPLFDRQDHPSVPTWLPKSIARRGGQGCPKGTAVAARSVLDGSEHGAAIGANRACGIDCRGSREWALACVVVTVTVYVCLFGWHVNIAEAGQARSGVSEVFVLNSAVDVKKLPALLNVVEGFGAEKPKAALVGYLASWEEDGAAPYIWLPHAKMIGWLSREFGERASDYPECGYMGRRLPAIPRIRDHGASSRFKLLGNCKEVCDRDPGPRPFLREAVGREHRIGNAIGCLDRLDHLFIRFSHEGELSVHNVALAPVYIAADNGRKRHDCGHGDHQPFGEMSPAVFRALAALILAGCLILMFCGITSGVYFDRPGRLPFGVGIVVPFARTPGRHRLVISLCLVIGAVMIVGHGVDLLFEAAALERCQTNRATPVTLAITMAAEIITRGYSTTLCSRMRS